MSEKHAEHIEHRTNNETLSEAARESLEQLRKHETAERYDENEAKATAEKARVEANAEALFSKEYSTEHKKGSKDGDAPRMITRRDKDASYQQTMNHIQAKMKAPSRTFSKVIHNPVVEKVSDAAGSTIARPNAILFGGLFAFLGVLGLYALARHIGFALSGFETIAMFIIGWIIGILVDFFRTMITGKR